MWLAKWDDVPVELDALLLDVLRRHIAAEIESCVDFKALCRVRGAFAAVGPALGGAAR
jgi:hypothetical protein